MKRHLRSEPERFVCYAGYKSFYMDWNYDMWRCDAWKERLCPIWDFETAPHIRDGCTACIADCYRDSSVMLHFVVSLGDAIDQLAAGRIIVALKTLADRRNFVSLGAVIENAAVLSRLAKLPGLLGIVTQPDLNTLVAEVRREDGSVVGGGTYVVSPDGNSLTATTLWIFHHRSRRENCEAMELRKK
jgi:hypothetical protein